MLQHDGATLAPFIAPTPAEMSPVVGVPGPDPSRHLAVVAALTRRRTTLARALNQLALQAEPLTEAATCLVEALRGGRTTFVAGNGGSAAEAQHFAAELVGRFKRERAPYPVLALTTDTSILTAVGNDYGYREVFARQLGAFARPGDVFLAFSTSGESENLLRAAEVARQRGVCVVAVTGERPSRLAAQSDVCIRIPLRDTDTVQELHMLVTHLLCDIVETELSATDSTEGQH